MKFRHKHRHFLDHLHSKRKRLCLDLKNCLSKKVLTDEKGGGGFTFIELVIAIGIIGILSSVVMNSVNSARAKARDANIKSELRQIITQGGVYQIDNGNFGATDNVGATASCTAANTVFSATTITELINGAQTVSGGSATCASTATKWVISIPLASNSSLSWCVDSSGATTIGTANTASDAVNCTATPGGGDAQGGSDNISDTDADGLTYSEEINTYHTDPNVNDTDGDTFSDGAEVLVHLTDPLDSTSYPNIQGQSDTDGDGIPDNTDNCDSLVNPNQVDSNGNGIGNGCDSAVDYDTDGFWDTENPDDPSATLDECRYEYAPTPTSAQGGNGCTAGANPITCYDPLVEVTNASSVEINVVTINETFHTLSNQSLTTTQYLGGFGPGASQSASYATDGTPVVVDIITATVNFEDGSSSIYSVTGPRACPINISAN